MSLKDEVAEILQENIDLQQSLFEEYIAEENRDMLNSKGIKLTQVQQHGGEGEGDQYWTVYQFEKNNEIVYVKFEGWYASHYGCEYTGFEFVKPKQEVVTVYS